jgi:hypothetical protein
MSSPGSAGASLELCPGVWGMEELQGYPNFVNWRPSLSLDVARGQRIIVEATISEVVRQVRESIALKKDPGLSPGDTARASA